MIYVIETKTEYGKHGTTGINVMVELTEHASTAYAHSKEQALAWVKQHKAFTNAELHDYVGDRYAAWSEWREKDYINFLYNNGSDVQRFTVIVCPVNTIWESTGYK